MKVHNVGFDTITEGVSKKRRQYDATSPLRKSHVLDGRELFCICKKFVPGQGLGQGVSYYPSYIFKSKDKAQEFLNEVGASDHEVCSIYDKIRSY